MYEYSWRNSLLRTPTFSKSGEKGEEGMDAATAFTGHGGIERTYLTCMGRKTVRFVGVYVLFYLPKVSLLRYFTFTESL